MPIAAKQSEAKTEIERESKYIEKRENKGLFIP